MDVIMSLPNTFCGNRLRSKHSLLLQSWLLIASKRVTPSAFFVFRCINALGKSIIGFSLRKAVVFVDYLTKLSVS
jgi:hypothetical protein